MASDKLNSGNSVFVRDFDKWWASLSPEERTPDRFWAALNDDNWDWDPAPVESIPNVDPLGIYVSIESIASATYMPIHVPNFERWARGQAEAIWVRPRELANSPLVSNFNSVSTSLLTARNDLLSINDVRFASGVLLPPVEDLETIESRRALRARYFEARDILGLDPDSRDTFLPYKGMTEERLFEEVDKAKEIQALLASKQIRPETLMKLAAKRTTKFKPGPKWIHNYNQAFRRWHIDQTHSQLESFELMLTESNITCHSAADKQSYFDAFKEAMKTRRRKYEKGELQL